MNIIKFKIKNPPPQGSKQELDDLNFVYNQYNNKINDEQNLDQMDEDVIGVFGSYLNSVGETLDRSYLTRVSNSLLPIIFKLKDFYGRERPQVTAKRLGLDYSFDNLPSADCASYPSGHTIQAYVVGEILANQYPEYSNELIDIAEKIALSRIDRGVHFPSDIEYGKEIAYEILNHFNLN